VVGVLLLRGAALNVFMLYVIAARMDGCGTKYFTVCIGMEWNGMEWNGMEWNGMEWNGMEWNGMEWNGMEWNGMEWDSATTKPQAKGTLNQQPRLDTTSYYLLLFLHCAGQGRGDCDHHAPSASHILYSIL
jgi:hypothetical protein